MLFSQIRAHLPDPSPEWQSFLTVCYRHGSLVGSLDTTVHKRQDKGVFPEESDLQVGGNLERE